MKRCRHELVPLIPEPADVEGRFALLLCAEAGLLLCRHCGRVGFYTKWARKLAWLHPAAAERAKQRAAEWIEWNRKRCEQSQPTEDDRC